MLYEYFLLYMQAKLDFLQMTGDKSKFKEPFWFLYNVKNNKLYTIFLNIYKLKTLNLYFDFMNMIQTSYYIDWAS